MSKKLAELLLNDRIITKEQFDDADEAAKRQKKSYVRYLIESRVVAENKLLYYLSQKFGLPSINLDKFTLKQEVIDYVPADLAKRLQAVPIQANRGTLVVAVCDPTNLVELQNLKFKIKMNVEAVLTTYAAFDRAMNKYYGGVADAGAAIETFKKGRKDSDDEMEFELVDVHDIDESSAEQDAPVIQFVNGVLGEAIRNAASDIHVEPYEHRFRVRMRIDGVLMEMTKVPLEMKRAVVARIKVMSRMDLAESRVPQDGRIKLKKGGKEIDFRVNTIPTLFGEKVVLRILDKSNLTLDLTKLGFEQKQLSVFRKAIYSPNGMVLVTGPTGSGKTTTLYSGISELNKVSENVSTVEDPVEYNLDGINQVQTHRDIGLTFASILRAMLRQDPDVILVGEIRDFETAEVAIQAALTGHLVLSTLHTNDAPSSLIRLMNMGVEPFLVTSSVNAIVAQRLIRSLCEFCKVEDPVPESKLVEVGYPQKVVGQIKVMKGAGCASCGQTGYKGRMAIFEVMDFTAKLKELVLNGGNSMDLKKQAIKDGMKTLRMSALTKAAEGKTSLDQALAITMES